MPQKLNYEIPGRMERIMRSANNITILCKCFTKSVSQILTNI